MIVAVRIENARRCLASSHRAIRTNMIHISDFITIPQTGPAFYTLAGTAKICAGILLAPGEGLSKKWRRFAEKHEHIHCAIRADLGRSVAPNEFDRLTLLWALRSADEIALWSARFPDRGDEFRHEGIEAAAAGARFQTTIETNPYDAPNWFRWAQRYKRKAARLRVYGPAIEGGVQ